MDWSFTRTVLCCLGCGLIAIRLPVFQGVCLMVSCLLSLLLVEKVCEYSRNIRGSDVQSPP